MSSKASVSYDVFASFHICWTPYFSYMMLESRSFLLETQSCIHHSNTTPSNIACMAVISVFFIFLYSFVSDEQY